MATTLGAIVLDCPDPVRLAGFYGELLGWPVAAPDEDWVDLTTPDGAPRLSFQHAPDFRRPTWPDPERPQMFHLDLDVTDLEAEHERVLALGAELVDDSHKSFRVYLDPAGHPFCLCAC